MSDALVVSLIWLAVLGALTFSSVASYLRLLLRRVTAVAALRLFQPEERQRIKIDRELVGISLSALHGAAMGVFAIGAAALFILARPLHLWEDLGAALLVVLCAVALCDQMIPFRLVARHDEAEAVLKRWIPFLRLSVPLALPFTFPVLISTTIARLLEPAEINHQEPRAQGELHELIQAGEKEGLIEKAEGELLQSVVEFGDKVVREVMTPRPEIAALDIDSPVEELRRLVKEKRHSRYPVYSGQIDHIEGIVTARDLMELRPEEQTRVTLRSLVRSVPFVPETKPVQGLLKQLQQSTTQLAIVIDEYGSVSGLVTIEDLVEEIVGEIRDEVEPHAQDIVKESAGSYIIAGNTELAQVADQFHLELEGGDYSTVAGLVLFHLGHVPAPGEKVETNGVSFEVLEANQRTVLKVRLRLLPMALSAEARVD
jgi:CBS domain containing-hemolysin-like protein